MPPKPKVPPKPKADNKAAEIARLRDFYKKNGHIPTLLSNASKARFGESDSKDVGELGRLVALGKISRQEAEDRVKKGAAVNDPDTLRAGLDVSAALDPQISAATRKREAAKAALESGLKQDDATTRRFTSDAAGLYEALQKQMASLRPQTAANFDNATAGVASNTSTLQQQIREAYEKANAATAQRVAGMGGGTTQGQMQGSQDQAFLSSLAGIQGQSQLGTLAVAKTGAEQVGQANQNYAGFEGANVQANALRELLERTNAARSEHSTYDRELGGQIQDLEGTRYAKVYEGRQSLAESRAAAQAEAEQSQFERQLASAKLGIDQQEVDIKKGNLGLAARRVDLDIERFGLDRQKVELDARKTEAQLVKEQRAYTPGTLEYLEKEASINLKRANAASTLSNAATNKQNAATAVARQQTAAQALANKPKNYGKGIGGVNSYLDDIGADPKSKALVTKNVNNVIKKHKDFNDGLKSMEAWISKHKPPSDVANAMRRSVGIAYGRSS